MAPGPALVVGLGNPGTEYAETRHNVGVRVAEVLAARAGGGRFSKHKANADVLEGRLAGRRAVLAVPRTFMNVSGGPVAGLLRYYGVAPTDLVVVHDDLDLGFGVVRLKQGGGEGGHNGLRSIAQRLGAPDFLRLRVGVGRPGRGDPRPVADYVLSPFAPEDDVEAVVARASDAVESLVGEGLEETQRRFN